MIKLILRPVFLGPAQNYFVETAVEPNFKDEKNQVIVNEFGQINIDGTLVEKKE